MSTYLGFLHLAQTEDGRFRNLMSYGRAFAAETVSEDCTGRALWSLGTAVHLASDEGQRMLARQMFERGLGFARWADEVAAQEHTLGTFFDTIVTCSVTGSTQAGMIAGFAAQNRSRSVLGIDGSATVGQTREQIARIARRTAEAIELGRDLADEEIVLLDEWHAGAYGIPDEKTIAAIRTCARLEGVLTDPVYEGKSMAALIDLVRDERIAPGSRVLYAHLGGQPALNAYASAF